MKTTKAARSKGAAATDRSELFDPDGSAYTREGGAARDAGVAGPYKSELFDPDGSAYTREDGAARDTGVAGPYGSELFDPDGQQYNAPDPAAGDESNSGRGQGSSVPVSSSLVGAEHPRSAPMQVPETTTQTEPQPEDIRSLIREVERLPEQDRVVVLAAFRRALDAVAGRAAEAIGPPLPQLSAKDEAAIITQGRRTPWEGRAQHRTNVFEWVREHYGRWMPGLLLSHLMAADRPLYLALCKRISREGRPEWFDVPTRNEARIRNAPVSERAVLLQERDAMRTKMARWRRDKSAAP